MPMLYPRREGVLTNPLVLALLGSTLVVFAVAILPVALPSALADERAYLDAPPCPESVSSPREAGECRDGEREVLIAASRHHVPRILSGLRFQPQPR